MSSCSGGPAFSLGAGVSVGISAVVAVSVGMSAVVAVCVGTSAVVAVSAGAFSAVAFLAVVLPAVVYFAAAFFAGCLDCAAFTGLSCRGCGTVWGASATAPGARGRRQLVPIFASRSTIRACTSALVERSARNSTVSPALSRDSCAGSMSAEV